jgi:hypothetical protein
MEGDDVDDQQNEMDKKIFVYRCSVCEGTAASPERASVIRTKAQHFDATGHVGRITKEDQTMVESD